MREDRRSIMSRVKREVGMEGEGEEEEEDRMTGTMRRERGRTREVINRKQATKEKEMAIKISRKSVKVSIVKH
jgi:hypothetical protein